MNTQKILSIIVKPTIALTPTHHWVGEPYHSNSLAWKVPPFTPASAKDVITTYPNTIHVPHIPAVVGIKFLHVSGVHNSKSVI